MRAATAQWRSSPWAPADGSAVATTRRPLEPAQAVWARAVELAAPPYHELFGVILEVTRAAHHDSATIAHALTLGRSRLRDNPADVAAGRAMRLLERAIEFLGVKSRLGEVGTAFLRS